MVLLTMTPGIVRAVKLAEEVNPDEDAKLQRPDEPTLAEPKVGNPISHSQLIDLSKILKKHAIQSKEGISEKENNVREDTDVEEQSKQTTVRAESKQDAREDTPMEYQAPSVANDESTTEETQDIPPKAQASPRETTTTTTTEPIPTTLSSLLTGTQIYLPPPPSKPTQTPEYHALMSRLRAEQESLAYEKMLNPPPPLSTYSSTPAPSPFSTHASTSEDDELTYDEVHRQIILIINILISIVCVAVFIWVAARHWSVGSRLSLSLGGSLGIAVAEVAVYSGYVRKVAEAKRTEKRKPEVREIVKSWVLGNDEGEGKGSGWKEKEGDGVRFRKGKHR